MAIRRRRTVRKRPLRRKGRRVNGVSMGIRGAYPTLPPIGALRTRRGRRIPVGSKRRVRGFTATVTKRRRTVKDSAGYVQWDKSRFQRNLARLSLRKIVKANTNIVDFLWKRVGRLDGNGNIFAGNWIDQSSATYVAHRPIFLVDLTSGCTAGANHYPVVQLKRLLGSTPQYDFNYLDGYTSTGTLSPTWQTVVHSGISSSIPGRLSGISILKWSEIRMDLWGCKNHPCEWELTLCQLDPEVLPYAVANGVTNREAVDFWDSVSNKLCFSPSDRRVANGPNRNYVKVLDRRSFIINPTSSTESDADPHVRSVRLFYRMNRKCDFMWTDRTPGTVTVNVDPANNMAPFGTFASDDAHATVQPRARVFLMVTCKNWREPPTTYDAMTSANTASFNMMVYNRWIV